MFQWLSSTTKSPQKQRILSLSEILEHTRTLKEWVRKSHPGITPPLELLDSHKHVMATIDHYREDGLLPLPNMDPTYKPIAEAYVMHARVLNQAVEHHCRYEGEFLPFPDGSPSIPQSPKGPEQKP